MNTEFFRIGLFYFPSRALFSKESSSLKSSFSSVHCLTWNVIAVKNGEGEKHAESVNPLISEKEQFHCLFYIIKLLRIMVTLQAPECSAFFKKKIEAASLHLEEMIITPSFPKSSAFPRLGFQEIQTDHLLNTKISRI